MAAVVIIMEILYEDNYIYRYVDKGERKKG
jgi:hypothetical protein